MMFSVRLSTSNKSKRNNTMEIERNNTTCKSFKKAKVILRNLTRPI